MPPLSAIDGGFKYWPGSISSSTATARGLCDIFHFRNRLTNDAAAANDDARPFIALHPSPSTANANYPQLPAADCLATIPSCRQFSTTTTGCAAPSSTHDVQRKQTISENNFSHILLTKPEKFIAHLELNSPKSKNAFSLDTARELVDICHLIDEDTSIRCAILSGNGSDLTSGVDVKSFMGLYQQLSEMEDPARKAKLLLNCIRQFQEPFKRLKALSKPIICVSHGLCFGLGMELAACCDIRYCSKDAKFAIREVLIGLAADVGSLQLMPALISNQSLLRELIYTGRNMTLEEVMRLNFVSHVSDTKDDALIEAFKTAKLISAKSPTAVQGSKLNLEFSHLKPFETGLDYNAIWNMSMIQSGDVAKAISAIFDKSQQVEYEDF